MNLFERLGDSEEAFRLLLDGHRADIWTAMPGHIVSFDPNKQTATVQVGVKGKITKPDGTLDSVAISVIPDVMVAFPNGGGATLTFPVKPGDECHLVFSSRNHDSWYQSGGIQEPLDQRMHDTNDAIAYVGVRSQAKKLSNFNATKTQLRADDGNTIIELDHTGKNVNVIAPTAVTITSPIVHMSQDLQVDGTIVANKTITSKIDVFAQTVSLHNHQHSNSGGTGIGGPPVP